MSRRPEFGEPHLVGSNVPEWYHKINWAEIPQYPLSEDALFCIEYMRDVEGHTPWYKRHLMGYVAMKDPKITDFLATWESQELFHDISLSRFVEGYGLRKSNTENPPPFDVHNPLEFSPEQPRHERIQQQREELNFWQKHGWVASVLIASVTREAFLAAYGTIGAINELTTKTGYVQLSKKAEHPVLSEILSNIIPEESNHFAYYKRIAEENLSKSRKARTFARFVTRHFWSPVGEGFQPSPRTNRVINYLLGDEKDMRLAERINNQIREFPGLGDFNGIIDQVKEARRAA